MTPCFKKNNKKNNNLQTDYVMSNNKIIKWAVIIVLAILIGLSWINLAFSFATMLLVAMILIVIEYLFYMRNPSEVEEDYRRRSFAITLVGCYGFFAIFTMSNYFYPPMEVFSNNDHHAIAVEGVETTNTSLLLAADDHTAFFERTHLSQDIFVNNLFCIIYDIPYSLDVSIPQQHRRNNRPSLVGGRLCGSRRG